MQEIENAGAHIHYYNTDITNKKKLKRIITVAEHQYGKINGVIHAAGVADYAGLIYKRTVADTEKILSAKLYGTIILHELLAAHKLDFFILCSGLNSRQVKAIADSVDETLRALKMRPAHTEGYDRAEWILMDYFSFIVHVFTPQTRAFYALERLWGDAEKIEVTDEPPAKS